jgi:hypothetical protein
MNSTRGVVNAMHRTLLSTITLLAGCALGCSTTASPGLTAGPTAPIVSRFSVAAIGDVIHGQVTTADVPCDFGYYCRYFQVVAPRDGVLEVGLTHTPSAIHSPPSGPMDMWVLGGHLGPVWMEGVGPNVEHYARVRAVAGQSYEVGVVSYELPGVQFQIRFNLSS